MQSNGSGMVAGLQKSLHSYKSNFLPLKGLNPNSKNASVSFSLEKKKKTIHDLNLERAELLQEPRTYNQIWKMLFN